MELVDRYLQAVKFWLPREQQDDIAGELSADIFEQIEEEERGLGRLMTQGEIETVLKRRGRPFVVANRYLPQRQLIGPLLFPMYTLVLKLIGLVYLLPWIIVWTFLLAFVPSSRGHIARDLGTLWSIAVQIFAAVTIVFALVEHYFGATKLLAEWDPRRLPAVRPQRDVNRIPRASSIAEVAANVLFIAWWAGGYPIFYGPFWISGTIFPEFHRLFFVPILFLAMITAAVAVVNIVRPYWTRARRAIRAAANGATAAIAGWAVAAYAAPARASLARFAALHAKTPPPWAVAAIVDAAILVVLAIVAVVCAIVCAVEIYRATASSAYGTTSKLRS